jgi:hypothetical protein
MNFVDSVVVRLAADATRKSLFDDVSLAQLLSAQYDTDAMPLNAPYSPVFDQFELGVSLPESPSANPIRVDGFWRGRIVARVAVGGAVVDAVHPTWPDGHGIDAQIISAMGSLPADPTTLEHERRTRYVALLKAGMAQPDALTDHVFDAALKAAKLDSVGDLLASSGTQALAALRIHFAEGSQGLIPTPLPVAFALLVRDAPSIADLLSASKSVRALLAPTGSALPSDSKLRMRFNLGVAWVVPLTLFDDTGWPGADRDARRTAAGAWLAREGIGLITAS